MAAAHRIAIIQGHPDPDGGHFCHALARAYAEGARAAGREVQFVSVGAMNFPLLRSQRDFDAATPPPEIAAAQQAITWADHLVIIFPLWLGSLPALLKGFFEQVFRPGFTSGALATGRGGHKGLRGRSARIVVTMGMPAFVYRGFYRAHGVKNLQRNILAFVGIRPIATSLIGMVEGGQAARRKWIARMFDLGREAR
jgi:putative NADPH-quinone reductase